ncbi:SDR family NAD(P)-dependent oxidoreductase [Flavobacterium alkalisoli]|uniref:SDR family NAD(P)-dependent oxidoreductase n=1 Tax=Flavobacterium alkalisoli TaxID=2602769 RepID=A0A5B9G152_9FLAO|nr:SDR family NAD(P)-dependent oxidoreductase [Flavobacterium alkalisoli]QEE51182.1 SDR family NAD(P)-dependent oxidoreductase [Flavobacterium alkalisoli]
MDLKDNMNGALQNPLYSGFNETSTVHDVITGVNLTGKVAIVTGGYAGIGLETVKTFVAAGATVIVPARDVAKAKKNLKGINNVTIEQMDLMDVDSIYAFADIFLMGHDALDILVNNAGIMWVPLQRDKRGYESQLVTNHLGHFQLTARLWPALKNSGNARVVNVTSFGHQFSPFDFEDPNFLNTEYETLQGYGRSKTANNLFTVELDSRAKKHNVRAFSVHPGSVNGTDLGRVAPMALFQQMGTHDENGNIKPEVAVKLKTVEQGAATSVWCATSPQLNGIGGVYCENADIAVLDDGTIEHDFETPSTLFGVKPYSLDANNAGRLWKLSEEMTGVVFPVE